MKDYHTSYKEISNLNVALELVRKQKEFVHENCKRSRLERYKVNQHKKRVNYTINKHTIDRFKVVADKDMRKMSNIVENLIRRYVESRV
jgi:hypothetical protein